MRCRPLFLVPLLLLAACGGTEYDPPLADRPELAPTRIGVRRYLFSWRDDYRGARTVRLVGNFQSGGKARPSTELLDKNGDGVWRCAMTLDPGTYYYKFLVDGKYLVAPLHVRAVDRNNDRAGLLNVPDADFPYVSEAYPPSESVISNVDGVRLQIDGDRSKLEPTGILVKVDGQALKAHYDIRTGRVIAGLESLEQGQHILEVVCQDKGGIEVARHDSYFYYYKDPLARRAASPWAGKTAYRVLVPFFGPEEKAGKGTLRDLADNLDYLAGAEGDGKSLGISLLILHALVPATDPWGSAAVDYERLASGLGDAAEFRRLATECARRKITLIVHLNLGYCSNLHPFFQDTYGNPASRKRAWFLFPREDYQRTRYLAYRSDASLPRLNLDIDPPLMEFESGAGYFLEQALLWLRIGADGLFFEHADLLPDRFWYRVAAATAAGRSRLVYAAQATGGPDFLAQNYQGKFDLVEDPQWTEQCLLAFRGRDPSALGDYAAGWERSLPTGVAYLRPLSSGPWPRLASALESTNHVLAALGFSLTSGGVPVLGWGDELGLSSPAAPLADQPPQMPWSAVAAQTRNPHSPLNLVKRLIRLREQHPELRADILDGKPVLRWARKKREDWSGFVRQSRDDRFFAGVLVRDPGTKTVSPEFDAGSLADGVYVGRDMLLPSNDAPKCVVKKGRIEDLELATAGRGFLLFLFERQ